MKRTSQNLDYQGGRRRQRATESTTTTRTIEDLAEAESFTYQRVEADYTGAWKAGLNLGLVAAVGIIIAALTAVLTGASLAWLPFALVVGIPAAVALPTALIALYSVKTQASIQRRQYIDAQAAQQVARRRFVENERRLIESATEAQYRLADVQRRTESRQLALAASCQDDLRQFVAGVFVRGESPSFRQWKDRQLASGQALTHGRWKAELVGPLVAVGAIQEPAANGKPYDVIDGDYRIVEDKLRRAGYLQ